MPILKEFDRQAAPQAAFLYLSGGKDNKPLASPYWGTPDPKQLFLIGDSIGTLFIQYADGISDAIPMIYGYTVWWDDPWKKPMNCPFLPGSRAAEILGKTLHLKKAMEGDYPYLLRIKLRSKPVVSIGYEPNPDKDALLSSVEFRFESATGCVYSDGDFDIADPDGFFDTHTVDVQSPLPMSVRMGLEQLRVLMYTFEWDIQTVDFYNIPQGYTGTRIIFGGAPEANILTSVFHHNLVDQIKRIEPDGLLRESAKGARLYYHGGMGSWMENAGAYAENYYTRNDTVPVLSDMGYLDLCEKAIDFLDRSLMFFPKQFPKLQLDGKPVPGHFTVVAEKPLYYSEVLSKLSGGLAWPTKYTKERFGEHCEDFGNPETDGHGHSMITNYKVWIKRGRDAKFVEKHWEAIVEAADYLIWHLDNPELSFSEDGLLYGETEAGLCDCSLQCNIPCYVGLLMYADMAESVGKTEEAARWKACADGLAEAIERKFLVDGETPHWEFRIWLANLCNMLTFFHKYYGNNVEENLCEKWFIAAKNTYRKDRLRSPDRIAPEGLGYDHNMFTQVALLLDEMQDADKWVRNLARLCYSPRHSLPYIVPESAAIDMENGIYRRIGDLGNGIQQSETLVSLLLCTGVDNAVPERLRIMPRLPHDFTVSVTGYPITVCHDGSSYTAMLDYSVEKPADGEMVVTVCADAPIPVTDIRVGPFSCDTEKVLVQIGDKVEEMPVCAAGDSTWVWLKEVSLQPDVPFTMSAKAI